MAKDYQKLAAQIVTKVGGNGNIADVTHCMTRLRFDLKDEALADTEGMKNVAGVMGVVEKGGQYQVIIGNEVAKVYREVVAAGSFEGQKKSQTKEKLTLKTIGNNILDALIGTMTPLIPAIIGGSMVKLLVMILSMAGLLSETSSTYTILNVIGDGAFYFLPIMVAVSAAKKFNTNTYLALAVAGVLVHPAFGELMTQAAAGEAVTFFFAPVASVTYIYTVIPALVMTWLLSYIERGVDKITPAVTKNFLKPMLIIMIAAPIAILLVGPAGVWLGTAISSLVYFIHGQLGWLAVAIMGAIWPLLVTMGMHHVFTPTTITTIAQTGTEGLVMPAQLGANLSLGGVSLAVAWKTKNHELRQTALAAASSAIVAGITEPALYGVAIRLKRPLIASVVTGFVCGALAGIAGLSSHSMATPSLVTSVQFLSANPTSLVWIIAIMVVAVALSFILTLALGFEDIPEATVEAEVSTEKKPLTGDENVLSLS